MRDLGCIAVFVVDVCVDVLVVCEAVRSLLCSPVLIPAAP